MTLVDYFKGAVHSARFTRRALTPAEFTGIRCTLKPEPVARACSLAYAYGAIDRCAGLSQPALTLTGRWVSGDLRQFAGRLRR